MTIIVLFALVGIALFGAGISRGSPLMALAGAFLLVDAMVFWVLLGPALHLAQSLVGR